MRELRYVGRGDDAEHVIIESDDGLERYTLLVDAGLRDALRLDAAPIAQTQTAPTAEAGAHRAPEAAKTEPASISPREIQTRVRAGTSPDALAAEYGVDLARVLRFAQPVLDERARIADTARRARAHRVGTGTDGQTVVFGETVDERFTAHGVDPVEVAWDARRREDGNWQITAGWTRTGVARQAEWMLHLATNLITPVDDTAGDLLSDRPIRPTVSEAAAAAAEDVRRAAAPPLRPGIVAFPVMPDTNTGPVPFVARRTPAEPVFDQQEADTADTAEPASVIPVALDELVPARAADAAGAGEPDVGAVFEPLPLALPDLPAALAGHNPPKAAFGQPTRRRESDEERAARARIPSWDDILLGVRRKQDG